MIRNISCLAIVTLLFFQLQTFAQQNRVHHPHRPPSNPGYTFTRGLFVDCADEIINDVSGGNPLGLEQELIDYVRLNYFKYIILCGLEHANIFGNSSLENALRNFMSHVRTSIPGIRIGIGGCDTGTFQNTGYFALPTNFGNACFPMGTISNYNDLNAAVNDSGQNGVDQNRTELCKFYLRAAMFSCHQQNNKKCKRCDETFDDFYIEYRYWNQFASLTGMQKEFNNFKTILSFLQVLKCNYKCIRNVDAEFLPTNRFNLQSWTDIDQITDIDPLADRLMVPVFTNDANGIFDLGCKTLHYLSDRFSKKHSEIFIKMSAESPSFSYCNSTSVPGNYLGDYLNGSTSLSGNIYSVEKMFLNKLNDSMYMCLSCSCFSYPDNHYSSTNVFGNALVGSMWAPYSMMKDHNLFKYSAVEKDTQPEDKSVLIQYIDLSGRIIQSNKAISDYEEEQLKKIIPDGIYIRKILFNDGRVEYKKILINHL